MAGVHVDAPVLHATSAQRRCRGILRARPLPTVSATMQLAVCILSVLQFKGLATSVGSADADAHRRAFLAAVD